MSVDVDINRQLLLSSVRQELIRQEETIIFALIERSQFRQNPRTYLPGEFPELDCEESLVGHLLRETECVHARMRRYTSPDEHPFFDGLPEPALPPLAYLENPLVPNGININGQVRDVYERGMVPVVCAEGDDGQYGSSSLADIACLQAISRRVHYGKFVAESKARCAPETFAGLQQRPDPVAVMAAITDESVEAAVLARVRHKAETYLSELARQGGVGVPLADALVEIYARWIIPLNKDVQVSYLLARAACHER